MKTVQTFFFFSLFILVVFFSCKKTDVTHDGPGTTTSTTLNKTLMLQLVNDVRSRGCNCGSVYYASTTSLRWNDQLESAANAHADDMSRNNYFNHTGLNGSSPGERILAAGYSWSAYGENIAKGFSTEQAVMDGWLASPEHCINIMNPVFKDFGAAKVNNYWVQEFGAK